jgi:hypothetical protein
MKIGIILSDFRQLIKEVSNDSNLTDSFLWSLVVKARARILTNDIKSKQFISPWATHRFCIKLEKTKAHDCNCVPVGCEVLKSEHPVPRPLVGRYRDAVQVKTLGGTLLGYSEDYELKSNMYDAIKKYTIRWNVHNQHIYLYNTVQMDTIQLEGVWENVLDWHNIQHCTEDNPCQDIYDMESGISQADADGVIRIAFELLNVTMQIKDDSSADTNPEIR